IPEALFQVGSCLYNSGDYNKALKVFKKLVKNKSLFSQIAPKAQYKIAWCYWQMNKQEESLKEFNRYLAVYPDSPLAADVLLWLGKYDYEHNQFETARKYFDRIISEFPAHQLRDDASYWTGWTFYSAKDLGSALEQFKNMAARYPKSELTGDALLRVGDILSGKKEYKKAVNYYRKALEQAEGGLKAEIQFQIAKCYQRQNNIDQAKIEYLKVSYLYPESGYWALEAKIRAADIFEQQRQWDEAKAIYEKIASSQLKEAKYARKRLEWIKDNVPGLSLGLKAIMDDELQSPGLKIPELVIPQTNTD
ncbi:MAG: tetratricopeptide repeat protein, partial [Candidatus Omnitrophota bacterium]|nr:tetratricopeptide repeat protein [Candidatus Omnitrophota bacterium]